MKRTWRAILALTLVCAVALTAAAMALGSKALPLTMTDACTIGDPAAAEGLHMAARIGMEQNRLQWRMDYDPAADTTDASFRLAYSDRSGQWIFDGYGYNIQCLLVNQEDDSDPICREVLPLSLSGALWSGGGDFCDVYGPWDVGDTVPFPALSIPVRESDHLTVALARNADGSYEINGYDFTGISSAMYFTPFSLPLEGGTLTTLGIDPAAQPQPDWAPEGYGLWYVPVQTDDDGSSTPVPSRRQLVYPLDITRQQVVTLKQEKLGGTVYLMTQEDGQLVLRLLEGGTYRLLQELSLGPVPESDPGTGGYHTLTVRDGFAVVLWEDQMTVLSRTDDDPARRYGRSPAIDKMLTTTGDPARTLLVLSGDVSDLQGGRLTLDYRLSSAISQTSGIPEQDHCPESFSVELSGPYVLIPLWLSGVPEGLYGTLYDADGQVVATF